MPLNLMVFGFCAPSLGSPFPPLYGNHSIPETHTNQSIYIVVLLIYPTSVLWQLIVSYSTMAAAPKQDELMWDSPEFAKMYTSAEKLTGPYAQDLLDRTIVPDLNNDNDKNENKDLIVLDLACGTGIVSARLMEILYKSDGDDKGDAKGRTRARLSLTCSDLADAMVDAVTNRIKACGWPNAQALKADAMDTKLPSAEYTHIWMNFGPMLLPDWRSGLREMHRMLQPGGTLGLTSWKKVGWYADVRAAFETDPEMPAMPVDERLRNFMSTDGCWDDEEWVKKTMEATGFEDVVVEAVSHSSTLYGVDEFLPMVAGTVGFVTSKCWTKEQQHKYAHRTTPLVERYMREKYGDGDINWDWTALLITARKAA